MAKKPVRPCPDWVGESPVWLGMGIFQVPVRDRRVSPPRPYPDIYTFCRYLSRSYSLSVLIYLIVLGEWVPVGTRFSIPTYKWRGWGWEALPISFSLPVSLALSRRMDPCRDWIPIPAYKWLGQGWGKLTNHGDPKNKSEYEVTIHWIIN